MTQDKRNKTQDGKARDKLHRTPHWAWHGTLAWLGLLLAGPAQACTCASPAPTVDDLLQAADAVAEVRVTREYQLKYLILQARCEADAVCLDALARLDAGPAGPVWRRRALKLRCPDCVHKPQVTSPISGRDSQRSWFRRTPGRPSWRA